MQRNAFVKIWAHCIPSNYSDRRANVKAEAALAVLHIAGLPISWALLCNGKARAPRYVWEDWDLWWMVEDLSTFNLLTEVFFTQHIISRLQTQVEKASRSWASYDGIIDTRMQERSLNDMAIALLDPTEGASEYENLRPIFLEAGKKDANDKCAIKAAVHWLYPYLKVDNLRIWK